ncbi:MAG: glutamyl-tRNA reductase [Verrucomicrobiales bacterium]|jgi:glutamyl-tRNA reductase|nr:glutamyl-tRNA reductase [Verrucomicrobiales bacterium]
MNLFCVGADYKTHSVEEREKLSLGRQDQELVLHFFSHHRSFKEFLVLSTCNRTEFYFVTTMSEEKALSELVASLGELKKLPPDWIETAYYFRDREVIWHLFELVSGLKSMVVGETEIFGQVKDSYEVAQRLKTSGRVFNRLFQSAFAAAKQVRSSSSIGRGNVSVSSIARDSVLAQLPDIGERSLLVLGTGDTGRSVARAFLESGIGKITCSNRSAAGGRGFAEEIKADFLPWQQWRKALPEFDLVVTCTSAEEYILRREDLPANGGTKFLIDLGVPRNIDPAVQQVGGVHLLNIDHLQTMALQNLRLRSQQVEKCRVLLAPLVKRFEEHHQRGSKAAQKHNLEPVHER